MRILRLLVRWLLVPGSAAAVLVALVAGGRWAVGQADLRCPADLMVGGACVASWHTSVVEAAIYVCVVLAGIGVVLIPALIAPKLERTVAVLGFLLVVGTAAAAFQMTGWAELVGPLVAVAIAGAAGLGWVWSRGRQTHGP